MYRISRESVIDKADRVTSELIILVWIYERKLIQLYKNTPTNTKENMNDIQDLANKDTTISTNSDSTADEK